MTTVVFEKGIFYSDSQMTKNNLISPIKTKKIFHIETEFGYPALYYGFCGSVVSQSVLHRALGDFLETETIDPKFEDDLIELSALVYTRKRDLFYIEDGCAVKLPKKTKFFAIGSGETVAFTALSCGLSGKEALQKAVQMDVYSGGPVVSVECIF